MSGMRFAPRGYGGRRRGPDEVKAGEAGGGRATSAVLGALWAGRLPTLENAVKDVHQVPGLLRGVQTWLLVGLPLAWLMHRSVRSALGLFQGQVGLGYATAVTVAIKN